MKITIGPNKLNRFSRRRVPNQRHSVPNYLQGCAQPRLARLHQRPGSKLASIKAKVQCYPEELFLKYSPCPVAFRKSLEYLSGYDLHLAYLWGCNQSPIWHVSLINIPRPILRVTTRVCRIYFQFDNKTTMNFALLILTNETEKHNLRIMDTVCVILPGSND